MRKESLCEDNMLVLVASTSYPKDESDWKGVFIRRQLEALARRSDLRVSAWMPTGPIPDHVHRATGRDDEVWLADLMERGGIAHVLRTSPIKGMRQAISLIGRMRKSFASSEAGLFHVNWLQNALALPHDGRPALITALGTDMQLLRVPGVRGLVRRSLKGRAAAICPNADWMVPTLQAAFGDVADVRCVPFGIDDCWYSTQRSFELNATPRWICVTRLTAGKVGPLFDWAAPYFESGHAELHLLGPMQEKIRLPSWVRWHGPVSPDQLQATWFPQAQGLITLSQHPEGRPQVMLEALASGLPIVASRLAAHDDLLGEGDGGVLVDSPEATLAALRALADPVANRALGLRGRARVLADIGTWDDCAGRYVALYRHLQGRATP